MPGDTPAGNQDNTAPSGGGDQSQQQNQQQQKPDDQQQQQQSQDQQQKPDDQKETPKAPEKYEFKLQGEDGNPVELDVEAANAFAPVLKKHGITQDAVNEILPVLMAEFDRQDNQISEMYTAQRESWLSQAKSDKEFGGVNFEPNLAVAQKAMGRFGSPALKELLNQTGLGNHVEVLKLFHKVGQQISEDGHVSGGTKATGEGESDLAKLFDHPTSQHN